MKLSELYNSVPEENIYRKGDSVFVSSEKGIREYQVQFGLNTPPMEGELILISEANSALQILSKLGA